NGRCRKTAEKLDALVFQDGGDGLDNFHEMFSIRRCCTGVDLVCDAYADRLSMAEGANRLALPLLRDGRATGLPYPPQIRSIHACLQACVDRRYYKPRSVGPPACTGSASGGTVGGGWR